MLCLVVRLTVKPGKESEVVEHFLPLAEASRKEPGCLMYVAHQHKDDARKFLVYEQYADDEALEFHRNSAHFRYATEGLYPHVEEREAELYRAI
jgi:quinol monooxygenase YgiN